MTTPNAPGLVVCDNAEPECEDYFCDHWKAHAPNGCEFPTHCMKNGQRVRCVPVPDAGKEEKT
jgi:hypothetical protein